jgi:tryptophan 7-halogenase
MSEHPVRKILIVGGGTAGWMAAAAFGTVMPNVKVELVESDEIGIVGVGEATIPQINLFNATLGISDAAMLRETQATYKLGIEFSGWSHPGQSYFHPFGAFGVPINGLDFWHFWIRSGRQTPLHHFNANSVAAAAGRFAKINPQPPANSPLSKLFSAFHFDASLYAQLLRRVAEGNGIVRHEGRIVESQRDAESGLLTGVLLADGRRLEADLFIDCSGFRSLLLGEAMGVGYRNWSAWLPCDRALAVPTERHEEPRLYTRATAQAAGWTWRIPLQHRTGNGYVYSSAHVSDDEALETLLGAVDGKPLADPRPLRFTAGHRERFWAGNVIGLGLAGGFLEPLESTSIHLIQLAVSRLITLFPRSLPAPGAAAEFNRQSIDDYEGIRDFLVFHYWANRRDEPFWQERRTCEPPGDLLRQRLSLFRETGNILRNGNELFAESSWLAVMLGQGIEPEGYSLLADLVSQHDLDEIFAKLRDSTARAVAALPTQAEFIAMQASS